MESLPSFGGRTLQRLALATFLAVSAPGILHAENKTELTDGKRRLIATCLKGHDVKTCQEQPDFGNLVDQYIAERNKALEASIPLTVSETMNAEKCLAMGKEIYLKDPYCAPLAERYLGVKKTEEATKLARAKEKEEARSKAEHEKLIENLKKIFGFIGIGALISIIGRGIYVLANKEKSFFEKRKSMFRDWKEEAVRKKLDVTKDELNLLLDKIDWRDLLLAPTLEQTLALKEKARICWSNYLKEHKRKDDDLLNVLGRQSLSSLRRIVNGKKLFPGVITNDKNQS